MDLLISYNKTTSAIHAENDVTCLMEQTKVGVVAGKIATYNFEWRLLTLVLVSKINLVALQSFLQYYNKSVILSFNQYTPKWAESASQFVIFGYGVPDVSFLLKWIANSRFKASGKFLIVCTSRCELQQIFHAAANVSLHSVVLTKTSIDPNNLKLLQPGLFFSKHCFSLEPKITTLNSTLNCKNDTCFKSLFVTGTLNFNQCEYIVSTVHQPPLMYLHGNDIPGGVDGSILKLLTEMMNAKLKIITPMDNEGCGRYINHDWTGALGDVLHRRAQASTCGAVMTSPDNGNFQQSIPYSYTSMVWVTRAPDQEVSLMKLLHPLNMRLRLAIIFIFIMIVITNSLVKRSTIRKIIRRCFHISPKRSFLFYSWNIFLGMPIFRMTKKRSLQVVLITWVWYCFIIRCSYQATLVTSIQSTVAVHDICSINDAHVSGRSFGGESTAREYYRDDPDIYNNWVTLNKSASLNIMYAILNGTTDFVLAANKHRLIHYLRLRKEFKKVRILKRNIVSIPIIIYFRNYSIFPQSINRSIKRIVETGFVEFYKRTNQVNDDRHFYKRPDDSGVPETLNMDHFKSPFIVLFVGYAISIVYFIIELIAENLNKESV